MIHFTRRHADGLESLRHREPERRAIGANFGPADDVFEMPQAAVNVLPLFANSCEDNCTIGFAMVIEPE